MSSNPPHNVSGVSSNRSSAPLTNQAAHLGDEAPTPSDGDHTTEMIRNKTPNGSQVQVHDNLPQQRPGGTPPTSKVHPIMGGQIQGQPQVHPQMMMHPNQMPNNNMMMMNRPNMPGQFIQGGPQQQLHPQQFNNMNPNFRPQQFGNNPGINRPGPNPNAPNHQMSRFQGDNRAIQNMQEGNNSGGAYGSTQVCSGACTGWLGTWCPCICCCCEKPYKTVPEGYAGVILRFGKFHASVGPGMHYMIPDVDKLVLINKKEIVVDMKAQTVMSKDNTSFRLDSVLYYRMFSSQLTSFSINNLNYALQDLAATAIRSAVGQMTVQQFLQQKEHFADQIEAQIQPVARTWGAKVLRVLVQDVYLPADFQNSFSTSAVAKKISEAQVITSKAEVEVARLMKDAADALSTDAAFQIRYITSLEAIQKSSNPKMIFFPADYNDVGKANDGIVNQLMDETAGLLKK